MQTLRIIGWTLALLLSLRLIFIFVGVQGLIQMFPEGKKWWILPVQWLCIILFTVLIIINPFRSTLCNIF